MSFYDKVSELIGSSLRVEGGGGTPYERVLNSVRRADVLGEILSSLSGRADDSLLMAYEEGYGAPSPALVSSGADGGGVLDFDTGVGISSHIEFQAAGTGYILSSVDDPLGVLPSGYKEGDYIESSVMEGVVRAQGERDQVIFDNVNSGVVRVWSAGGGGFSIYDLEAIIGRRGHYAYVIYRGQPTRIPNSWLTGTPWEGIRQGTVDMHDPRIRQKKKKKGSGGSVAGNPVSAIGFGG